MSANIDEMNKPGVYQPIIWQDHVTEHPHRRKLIEVSEGVYDLEKDQGEVFRQGTPQSATNFNHMERGIFDAHLAEAYTAISLRQQGWRIDELAAVFSALAVSGIGKMSIPMEIPATGWEENAEGGDYPLRLDIQNEAIAASCTPILAIAPESMKTAIACGLSSAVLTLDGKLQLYAQSVPASPMTCELTLIGTAPDIPAISGGGGGSGGSGGGQTLPVASRTRLGVVRVGGGVNVTDDGEISVDASSYTQSPAVAEAVAGAATSAAESAVQTAVAENTATDEDVDNMMSEVFN
ncbi:MAG: hypothetical protein IJT94_17770 [Oscillibacter sp.]|nr:hypothetical protein [Oscillibacter sp.]